MSVLTKELLETIFDKKLDPLKKIDSLIESIDFFDGKLRELNSRVDVMEERSGQVVKK